MATRTLEGEFSRRVDALQDALTALRMYVEAAIDFPEEEIDFLADGIVSERLLTIESTLQAVLKSARIGRVLRDGMTLVIAGRPNAGKSSLLNALAGYGAAIVTDVPGTTRDVLRERIEIDGMPVHLVDTAGLRDTEDRVEREGVNRAKAALERADRVLWVFDGATDPGHEAFSRAQLPAGVPVTFVRNKADLTGTVPALRDTPAGPEVALSATHGTGMDLLRRHLRECMGYEADTEGEFIARRRHLTILERVLTHLRRGESALADSAAGELLAEELRLAQQALSEITGSFSADDLLGEIFSSFCIGK
jgi:tRNA modification GTPase